MLFGNARLYDFRTQLYAVLGTFQTSLDLQSYVQILHLRVGGMHRVVCVKATSRDGHPAALLQICLSACNQNQGEVLRANTLTTVQIRNGVRNSIEFFWLIQFGDELLCGRYFSRAAAENNLLLCREGIEARTRQDLSFASCATADCGEAEAVSAMLSVRIPSTRNKTRPSIGVMIPF